MECTNICTFLLPLFVFSFSNLIFNSCIFSSIYFHRQTQVSSFIIVLAFGCLLTLPPGWLSTLHFMAFTSTLTIEYANKLHFLAATCDNRIAKCILKLASYIFTYLHWKSFVHLVSGNTCCDLSGNMSLKVITFSENFRNVRLCLIVQDGLVLRDLGEHLLGNKDFEWLLTLPILHGEQLKDTRERV